MPPETDIDTLHALHRCSTPERWAAFMALAGYLVKHPEQRLGQAVVNKLHDRAHPSRMFYVSDDEARALLNGEEWTVQRGPHKEHKGLLAFTKKCVREDAEPTMPSRRTLDGCVMPPRPVGCTSESLPCGRSKCGVCYDLE